VSGSAAGILVVFDVVLNAEPVRVLEVGSVPAHPYTLGVDLFLIHADVSCAFLTGLLYVAT